MTQTRYQLVFSGRLQSGARPEQTRQAFKERFRLSDAQLDRLFSGQRVTVKRDLDSTSAERYQRAFLASGALVELEPATTTAEPAFSAESMSTLGGAPTSQPQQAGAEDDIANSPEARSPDQKSAIEPTAGTEESEAMQLLPTGSPIGEQPALPEAPPPDTSHLRLAPSEATNLEDCAPPPAVAPPLDLNSLELVPLEPSQQRE